MGRHRLTQQGRGTGGAPAPAPGCQQGLGSAGIAAEIAAGIAAGIAPFTSGNPPCTELPLEQPLAQRAPAGWLLVADSGPLCCPCPACEDGGTGSTEGQCHHPSLTPREASTGDLSNIDPVWGQYFLRGCSVCRFPLLLTPVGLTLCQSRGSPRAAVSAPWEALDGGSTSSTHILQIQQWDRDGDPHWGRAGHCLCQDELCTLC